jgi:beta-xylosidase
MGTLVRENDRLLYSFLNVDRVFDFILSIGMRPFVELSFMPKAIASGKKTVFSYQGNVTPPKSLRAWAVLVRKLASHWIKRYGRAEVREWFFEVWNEPNLKAFWTGTKDDYFELYGTTAAALKRVDPLLNVGGPATAKDAWIPEFLQMCSRECVAVDFVSTHHHPTDGRCCNTAIVIDWSKYLNRILELNPAARFARVEPGTICDAVVQAAKPYDHLRAQPSHARPSNMNQREVFRNLR